jgi:hypothetical protein
MNIGSRIVKRLDDLQWERRDLLDKVPGLSAQALSNLITRDSKRSEWDELIADALGVSILWLVYGKETPAQSVAEPATNYVVGLSEDEELLLKAFRLAGKNAKGAALMWAQSVLPEEPGFLKRAER